MCPICPVGRFEKEFHANKGAVNRQQCCPSPVVLTPSPTNKNIRLYLKKGPHSPFANVDWASVISSRLLYLLVKVRYCQWEAQCCDVEYLSPAPSRTRVLGRVICLFCVLLWEGKENEWITSLVLQKAMSAMFGEGNFTPRHLISTQPDDLFVFL